MNRIRAVFFLVLLSQFTIAQDSKDLLTRALSKYSTGNSFSSAGNFASISTANQTLKGSVFFLDRNNRLMYTIDFSAGSTGGISTLFDEGKLNSNISLGGDVRWLAKGWNQVASQSANALDVIAVDKEKITKDYEKKLFELINVVRKGKNSFKEHTQLKDFIGKIEKELKAVEKLKFQEGLELNYDIEEFEEELELLLEKAKTRSNVNIDSTYFRTQANYLNDKKQEKIDALNKKAQDIKIGAFKLHYWSFGYTAKRDDFKLFIDSLSVDKQLVSKDYVTHEIRFGYNAITNLVTGGKNSFLGLGKRKFFSIGAVFNYTSNLSNLTQIEVVDTKVIDSVSGRTRVKKQNAFEGEFVEDISSLNLFIDYYTFLSKDDSSLALHLNPELLISEFRKPISSFQIGFLIPLKDKKDGKTRINLEFFYKIKDIFNTTNNQNSLLNRNQIGIQSTFPFNF